MNNGFDVPFTYQANGVNQAVMTRRDNNASSDDLNFPPYRIGNGGPTGIISDKTVHVDVIHANGLLEYDVHNLYGTSEYHCHNLYFLWLC